MTNPDTKTPDTVNRDTETPDMETHEHRNHEHANHEAHDHHDPDHDDHHDDRSDGGGSDRSGRDPSRRGRGRGRRRSFRGMVSPSDRAKMFRAMHARRWLADNPSTEAVVAMLTEYQRDLEQEVADVADRIAELQRSVVTDPTAPTDDD